MADVLETFCSNLAHRLIQGDELNLQVIEQSYLQVKQDEGISESEEQSLTWCKFLDDRFSRIDLSKRDMSKVKVESLIKELYSLIAK
jgi:hypothetical protein